MWKAKRKRLSSKFEKSKTHVRDTGENSQPPEEDELSLCGLSDLDDQIDRLVDTPHISNGKGGRINEEGEDSDEDDLVKDIENDFNSVEQSGEPIGSNLTKIINNVIRAPMNKEKLVKKLERHSRPGNLDSLKVKKCSTEIWSEILQSKTRSKDLKTQKLQGCKLKAVGVISKVTDTLINLKSNKNLSLNNLRNSIGLMVHDCTYSLALLSHMNSSLEQTCRYNIAYCLDNQYHALRKNVPSESDFLSGDHLPKRIMNVTTDKNLFSMSSKPYNTSFKTSKNLCQFPQIPWNCTQNRYQRNPSGQYQKPYNSHSNSSKHQKQKIN